MKSTLKSIIKAALVGLFIAAAAVAFHWALFPGFSAYEIVACTPGALAEECAEQRKLLDSQTAEDIHAEKAEVRHIYPTRSVWAGQGAVGEFWTAGHPSIPERFGAHAQVLFALAFAAGLLASFASDAAREYSRRKAVLVGLMSGFAVAATYWTTTNSIYVSGRLALALFAVCGLAGALFLAWTPKSMEELIEADAACDGFTVQEKPLEDRKG